MAPSIRSRITAGAGALALAGAALSMTAAPAFADHGASPSDSTASCAEAGGSFADLGDGVTTCTVVTTATRDVDGLHPTRKWTVELTDTTTTVYTTTVTEVWVEDGTFCQNPGGQNLPHDAWNPETPGTGNPNCVEAYQNGGTQPGTPGFTIVAAGHWDVTVTHDESSETTTERTGCWNHGNQPVDLAHQFCQVTGVA